MSSLVEEGVNFVIRLKMGANVPRFYYYAEQKRPLRLLVAPINKAQTYRQLYYYESTLSV